MTAPASLAALAPAFEVNEFQTGALNQGQQIVGADPRRFGLLIVSNSTPGLTITTSPSPAAAQGLFAASNALPNAMMTFRDWGPLVQSAWFYNSGAAGQFFTVFTVAYLPEKLAGC